MTAYYYFNIVHKDKIHKRHKRKILDSRIRWMECLLPSFHLSIIEIQKYISFSGNVQLCFQGQLKSYFLFISLIVRCVMVRVEEEVKYVWKLWGEFLLLRARLLSWLAWDFTVWPPGRPVREGTGRWSSLQGSTPAIAIAN